MKWDLVDRLEGRYRIGPHIPNGPPEFGWRQWQATPINLEAAAAIRELQEALRDLAIEGPVESDTLSRWVWRCGLCHHEVDAELRAGHAEDCLLYVHESPLPEETRREFDNKPLYE